jgi:hypothetical protein
MEKIIMKAIEGGWRKDGFVSGGELYGVEQFAVLDPLFWQSLSKSCKWKKYVWLSYGDYRFGSHDNEVFTDDENFAPPTKGTDTPYASRMVMEEFVALRFHSANLTEGWDKAVAWLESLAVSEEK